MNATRIAATTIASLTIAIVVTVLAVGWHSAASRPEHIVRTPVTQPVWASSYPQQTGDTCMANASADTLQAYGVNITAQQYGQKLYGKAWNQDWMQQAVRTLNSELPKSVHARSVSSMTAQELDWLTQQHDTVLVSVHTQDLSWWSTSQIQGGHEITVTGTSGSNLVVFDSGYGAYKLISPSSLVAASYGYIVVSPS